MREYFTNLRVCVCFAFLYERVREGVYYLQCVCVREERESMHVIICLIMSSLSYYCKLHP